MKNQNIKFNQKPISSERIKSFQDFDVLLQKTNQDESQKTIFASWRKPYLAIAASACLFLLIGLGFWKNSNTKKTAPTGLAYSITKEDLNTAERLTTSEVVSIPLPKKGEAITTTILEENAMPENGSLEQVAEALKSELEESETCDVDDISSTKYIAFVVNKQGKITEIEAQGCEETARKVLSNFPKWKSGKLQGQHLDQRVVVAI